LPPLAVAHACFVELQLKLDEEAGARKRDYCVRPPIAGLRAPPPAGEIALLIHWIGGIHSELRLPRRRDDAIEAALLQLVGPAAITVCMDAPEAS
jgi:hypothetical protein